MVNGNVSGNVRGLDAISASGAWRRVCSGRRPSWGTVFIGLVIVSLLSFVLTPWSMQAKSVAVLHGLCAQQPSHSFWFGAERLPFDARMTGIYGGFLIGQLYLLCRGRLRAAGVPSLSILLLLVGFVVALGIDGFNSTLDDANLVPLYQPNNTLRFITGALTGTTLAVFIWLLVGNVVWRPSARTGQAVITGWHDLARISVLVAAFGLVVRSGWAPLYRPIALVLIVAATLALMSMALAFIQLVRHREGTARSVSDLAGPAIGALLTAYLFLFLAGGGRYLVEGMVGV